MLYINMYWCCDVCDKVMYEELRDNHLQSGFHKRSANSIIKKCFVTDPKPTKIENTIGKYLRSHYKTYENFQVILSVKLILPSNQIKNFRRQHQCH